MREYRKIIADGERLAVIVVTIDKINGELVSSYPDFVLPWINLKGIEFIPATPEDFMEDYERRYGKPVSV